MSASVHELQAALLNLAEQHVDVAMPGYTHLQRAQPITFAHYLLGQMEAFERDVERLRDCVVRTDVLPLGSGALAGSTIMLDREGVARDLGFSQVSQNSVDAVSDRDFVCEFLFCLTVIGAESLAPERGLNYLEYERIRFPGIQRCIFHGLQFDATEEKSGYG